MKKIKTVDEWTIFETEQGKYFAEKRKNIFDDICVIRSTPILSEESWKERRQYMDIPESVKNVFDNIFA